ncbi:MAG: GNAT family N-acetyltransferase [Tepidisphaeraceae bacterium]|jgi:GNAT superfamily N-acetyltransferase
MPTLSFRYATQDDVPLLAKMNRALIVEEKHRNNMTMDELVERMRGFLAGEYKAVVFEQDGRIVGHALYRRDPEWFYLRQFFVDPAHRRRGVGKSAIQWMMQNCWQGAPRIRVDVLSWNPTGIAFWRAVGFADYCITLEKDVASHG